MRRSRSTALVAAVMAAATACSSSGDDERLATLEQQVDELVQENRELRDRLREDGSASSTVAPSVAATADGTDPGDPAVEAAGAITDGADPALAVQRDLQAEKITLWALSDAGLVRFGDTWSDAVTRLENCDTWANDPRAAQGLIVDEFATRVYRIVLDHYCPEHLPLLEEAAPPPVTVAELNSSLGLVVLGWLAEPSRETYDPVAAVATSLLDRPLPDALSVDPAYTPAESLRELTEYPGSEDAVREILDRLAIGEEHVAAEAAEAAAPPTSAAPDAGTSTATSNRPPTMPAPTTAPVSVEELNEVLGPAVQQWVATPNPDTYDAIIAIAEELLRRPLPDELTDDDSVSPVEVLEALFPYPGTDTEVISILDQLELDVQL